MLPRPMPSRVSRRTLMKILGTAAVGTVTGTLAHGYLYERHDLEMTAETLRVRGLSPALRGLRIGMLTDLHRSQTVPYALIAAAVQMLMAQRPDLIVLGGDYISFGDRRYVGAAAEALAPLAAQHGVFAILGNHDDDRYMPAALSANRFVVLRDARARIEVKGESLDLVGIRYWTRKTSEIARLLRGSSPNTILLAHTPMRLLEAAELSVPLMLSGHTHGGQIVLPGVGAIAAREFPIVAGTGQRDRTTAFVSRGVGTVYIPVRLNCPPEVAVLTLDAAA